MEFTPRASSAFPGSNGHASVQPVTPGLHGHAATNGNHHASRRVSNGHDVRRGKRSRRVARPRSNGYVSVQSATPGPNGHAATFPTITFAPQFKRSRRVARPRSNGHASVLSATPSSNGHASPLQMRMPRTPIQIATARSRCYSALVPMSSATLVLVYCAGLSWWSAVLLWFDMFP